MDLTTGACDPYAVVKFGPKQLADKLLPHKTSVLYRRVTCA